MNRLKNITRLTSGLVVALVGLMIGSIVPGYCLDLPFSGPVAKTLLTSPSWFPTGNLNTARVSHTATLLRDGKVLVVGGNGIGDSNYLDSAELYDAATGAWSVTEHTNIPRSGHTATLLPDGRVLVIGGFTGVAPPHSGWTDTAEIYDPATGKWNLTGTLLTTHIYPRATLLRDGKVLIAGGGQAGFRNAELYDPITGTWSVTGSLNVPRYAHQATQLQDGRVMVTGGLSDDDNPVAISSAELYNPDTGTWSITGNLAVARYDAEVTLLKSGKVLIAGGEDGHSGFNSSELYDPATGFWISTGSLAMARAGHTTTTLQNGKVLVTGGYGVPLGSTLSGVELYDSDAGTWGNTSNLSTARGRHTATVLLNGKVLVAGGFQSGNPPVVHNSAELYEDVTPSPGTIDATFTGAWYDPAQSGHGLFVEILPGNRLFVGWFTFNPAGTEQAWFVGVGTYSGNTATVTPVSLPTGGRWIPNFNPNQIVNNVWGTLTFTFTDADHGKVDFNSVLGYGTGSMNLTRLTRPGLSTAATLHDAAATGTIGPGFTGSWYDPSQSGHGLFVEVLPDSRMFAGWFTFNPAGTEQAWFVGVGTYIGNTATISPVILPSGGRWIPNFNPNEIMNSVWGTLAFTFTDCNQGKVDFNSILGYGTGSMNLTRLTQPAGLTCP